MHDPVDALELRLVAAARRLQRPFWRRWRLRLDYGARMIALAAFVVIATPAVAAITLTWPGESESPTDARPLQFAVSTMELDSTLANALAVLRRPQTDTDRLPPHASLPPLANGVQLDATRRLLATATGGVYLVPVDAILPKPLQVLPADERAGPPGLCLALTSDAPAAFSCAPTQQLLGAGRGLSIQTALCVPGAPADSVSVQGLAVDQVADLNVRLADGTVAPLAIRDNLIDSSFARTNAPRSVQWTFSGETSSRTLAPSPQATRCEPIPAAP